MRWLFSPAQTERRLAARRLNRLRRALQMYGFNEDDGLPSEEELALSRDAALVELLRDYRLFFGTPEWAKLESAVRDAAAAEARRVMEAGAREYYAKARSRPDG